MLVMASLSKRYFSDEEIGIASVVSIEVLCQAMKSIRQTWQLA
jgi:hypothetical protein